MTKYRPDIDGLRAIAVGSVVLFHAGLSVVKGGFVGVDVFFVISGYLITANLHGDLQRGRFSIAGFYERRARRILPALFAMMAATALGAALFLPDDLKLFGESVAAATLSLSNVFFYTRTGYFDLQAEFTPLLHTWSLAVEEQFYLVFPLVLWGVARAGRGRRGVLLAVLVALWLASFGWSVWEVAAAPRGAFYLPFARAWELLTGALLAAGLVPEPKGRASREAGGALGLLLVLAPVFLLPTASPFPGVNALAPCLGAGLVIWSGLGAGEGAPISWSARLLRTPPMVGLGLISYSLYLWHWPLLVFAHYYTLGEPGPVVRVGVVVASLLLATASWRWIETPLRTRRLLPTRPALFGAAAGAGLLAGLFGGVMVLAHGLPGRFTPQTVRYAEAAEDHNPYRDHCFWLSARQIAAGQGCRIGVQDGRRPTLMVWGDSHADALMSAFDRAARAHGVSGLTVTRASCPPFVDVEVHEHEDNGCPAIEQAAIDLIERDDIKTVVLAARWAGYAEGRLYEAADPPVRMRRAGQPFVRERGPHDNHAVFAAELNQTIGRLRREGRRVYLVQQAPEALHPIGATLARAAVLHQTAEVAPSRADYDKRQRFTRATLQRLAARWGAGVIDPASRLCPGQRCQVVWDGRPLYYDADHLSVHGAAFVAPLVEPVFQGLAPVAEPRIAVAAPTEQLGAPARPGALSR